jgi:predicted ArsR family transcriptional regulator
MIGLVEQVATEHGPGLGESQRVLLFELKRRGEATLAELAAAELARETIRDHLKSLQASGLVERAGVRREGRGRPQVVYRLTAAGERLFPQREGKLLGELAEFLLAGGHEELLERFFAARNDRKRPLLARRLGSLRGAERLAEMAAALTEDGFLAEAVDDGRGGGRLRLCHCPWRHLVAVSRLPCRAEMSLVAELVGRPLARESFMPDGDSSCTYSMPAAAGDGGRPASGPNRQP